MGRLRRTLRLLPRSDGERHAEAADHARRPHTAFRREALTIVLGTASSEAVLPQFMRKLEFSGVKPSMVGLVVPTGASLYRDAVSITLTLAVVFIAQATSTPPSFGDLLLVLGLLLVTSEGATACRAPPS